MSSAAILVPKARLVRIAQLVGRIVALDVEGRIGFGIAEPLGVLEAFLEGQAFRLHAGQDVVAGAVEDAEDAGDRVAGQGFAHAS